MKLKRGKFGMYVANEAGVEVRIWQNSKDGDWVFKIGNLPAVYGHGTKQAAIDNAEKNLANITPSFAVQ